MNEFEESGTFYVSEWNGDPANAGTNLLPFSHPNQAPNSVSNIVVVGTGTYEGGWTGDRSLLGDGKVVIDFLGLPQSSSSNTAKSFKKIHFKNCPLFGISGTLGRQSLHENNIYENINEIHFSHGFSRNLLFIGLSSYKFWGQILSVNYSYIDGNLEIASSFLGGFSYNYVKGDLLFNTAFSSASLNTTFLNTIVNGKITIEGNNYELKRLKNGSIRPDANGLLLDFIDYYPNVYINGNFSGDAKIIDLKSKTVDPTSDLLLAQNTFGFIGGVLAGKAFFPSDSGPEVLYSFSGITEESEGVWRLTGDEGFIELKAKISAVPVGVPIIGFIGLLDFIGSAPDNVPDYFPSSYSPLSLDGLRPNHLTYKLRTSLNSSLPTFDSDWDNDNVSLGTDEGVFYDQKLFTRPTISDISGVKYGNANPLTVGEVKNIPNARWVHIKLRITNLRYF